MVDGGLAGWMDEGEWCGQAQVATRHKGKDSK